MNWLTCVCVCVCFFSSVSCAVCFPVSPRCDFLPCSQLFGRSPKTTTPETSIYLQLFVCSTPLIPTSVALSVRFYLLNIRHGGRTVDRRLEIRQKAVSQWGCVPEQNMWLRPPRELAAPKHKPTEKIQQQFQAQVKLSPATAEAIAAGEKNRSQRWRRVHSG